MDKREFVEIIAKRSKTSKLKIEEIFKLSKDLILEVLNKGGKIDFRDFGKFEAFETKERLFRNPITKRLFYSSKKKYIKIKLFKNFKYMIR